MDPLPIDEHLDSITASLARHPSLVIQAETGAGKTTRVPPALLDANLAGDRAIAMLEPRRIAARVAARRMAFERGTRVGGEVGYQVRFDRKSSRDTRILVMTEGVLLRTLQQDPFLERFCIVILDEFHERAVETDLSLALLRQVQKDARPDLRIVVMSATLDVEPLSRYLDECPVISSAGRSFPIDIEHTSHIDDRRIPDRTADGVDVALSRSDGDLLVFLPGVREIQHTRERIAKRHRALDVHELYGALPAEAQDAVLKPRADTSRARRVILATNIAETSITVPGITGVVDAGYMRVPEVDESTGLERLRTVHISKASAEQRAGRAGRLGPGHALRLWTVRQHEGLADHDTAEIHRADLTGPCLELLAWGERNLGQFPWFESPDPERIAGAVEVLERLGAIRDGKTTTIGQHLSHLPLQPRLGRLVLAARELGVGDAGALLAAILCDRLPRPRPAKHSSDSDLLDVLDRFKKRGTHARERWIRRMHAQIVRAATGTPDGNPPASPDDALRRALLAAFPDRLAVRRAGDRNRAIMVGGRGIELGDDSAVRDGDLFLVHELAMSKRRGSSDTPCLRATRIESSWIEPTTTKEVALRFDARRRKVEAVQRITYLGLTLEENPCSIDDMEAAAELLAREAARDLERALPVTDGNLKDLLCRLACLAEWMPELDLPAWDPDRIRALLPTLCAGKRSFDELRRTPLIDFVRGELTREQARALSREAPERFTVPSGSAIRIQYEVGKPPRLAVRIQELFGLHDTPTVAAGRVPLVLHLLAPNGRPQQVTNDLRSFWENTYGNVRKDLRARYPKHAWPEDPWNAQAEKRPRRKR